MTLRTFGKDLLIKPIRQLIFHVPFVKQGIIAIISTQFTDELSEQCIVDFLIKKYKNQSNSDFSVIDIGAGPPPNYYEICMKYTTHVYCVEPALGILNNPYASYTKKLINYAKKGKVTLFNGVISEKTGSVTFYKGTGSTINSSLDPNFRIEAILDSKSYLDSFDETMVESRTYQDYVTENKIENLLFVKVDVEGAEGRVLTTMNKSNAPKILLLEVAYDTGSLKEQIRRLVCEEDVFQESLFINKKFEDFNCDIVGEYRFNEHLNFLKDDTDLAGGSLILAQAGILIKDEILDLRQKIRSSIKVMDVI